MEHNELKKETNRGSGVYAVISTHYCTVKKEIMTEQEVLKKRMRRRSAGRIAASLQAYKER